MVQNRPVGIFDSGIGGLTVVKEFMRILPQEDVVYFGDTARVPYGPKSKETVLRFSIENILFLLEHNVKLIIIACNTSSSVALARVERNFKVPIIGVIRPGVEEAVRITRNKKIGIIGTRTTIKSGAYERQIKLTDPEVGVYSVSCPLFVPLVEEGGLKRDITKRITQEYLYPFKNKRVDTLILGCTHYPLLKPIIKEVLGAQVMLIDSAKQVVKQAKLILKNMDLLRKNNYKKKGRISFYVSDEPENFAQLGEKFLGFPLKQVKKINV